MAKTTIQYTTRDLRELGLVVEVSGKTDTDKTRQKAIEEIQRRMDDSEDTSLTSESFANGLSVDDLIVVEPLVAEAADAEDEPEIIQAVKAIATLANLRVSLEEAHQNAVGLRSVIEALFSPEPLTSEQMQQLVDKNFAKTLIKFAEAKAARDKFLPTAEAAWEILAPALPEGSRNSDRVPSQSKAEEPAQAAKAQTDAAENGQKVAKS